MRYLDWKHTDLLADAITFTGVTADDPSELRRSGYTPVAVRGAYTICVGSGYYHLARYCPPGRFDGVRLMEIGRTEIRYHDDDEIVEVVE